MSYSRKPSTSSRRPQYKGRGGPPAWLVFVLGIAFVFGVYYLWLGFGNYVGTRGLGIREATQQAVVISTATAVQLATRDASTQRPTQTPMPECQDFQVRVPAAVVRQGPSTSSRPLNTLSLGEVVCVIGREGDSEWYLIDTNPLTRRIDAAYMHQDIIQAVNPTPTPTRTFTPAPSVTPLPTLPPTATPPPLPTLTPDANATPTPTPTLTPTPTTSVQSA